MNSPGLRYMLLKSYFPVALLIAILLAILDTTTQSVYAQVKTVTVTLYVTLVQTVPVYVPVTAYVSVTSMVTSLVTIATTKISTFLSTATNWNTVTSVTTAMGILGSTPSTIFGPYSDVGVMGMGAVAGAAVTSLFVKLTRSRPAGGMQVTGPEAGLQGTGGVALLEYAKDEIQTAVSNISGVGTKQIAARKIVERKMGGQDGGEGQEDEEGEEKENEDEG
jgi:hypothetical protein